MNGRKEKVQMMRAICIFLLFFSMQKSFSYMTVNLFAPVLIASDREQQRWPIQHIVKENMAALYPFWKYVEQTLSYETVVEDESTYEQLLKLEGTDEDREAYEDGTDSGDYAADATLDHQPGHPDNQENPGNIGNSIKGIAMDTFIEATEKKMVYKREELEDFQTLVKQFYTIDASTMTDEKQLQVDRLLGSDMKLQKSEEPQILIYHTHASESYVDSVPGDLSTTVMGVGEQLKRILTEKYGYSVLHDTGIYDTVRAQAYNVAAPQLEKILADHPSIQVVIDLHRDQVQEETRLVTNLNGVPTAKFMFFNGLSRTKETGDIAYLANPYIDENLAFAFQMQYICNQYYPDLTRKIYLKGYRYNMQYRGKTLLIELGAQTNTVMEAKNACFPIAHALHMVLSGEMPDNS